jgi:hypothetical protein
VLSLIYIFIWRDLRSEQRRVQGVAVNFVKRIVIKVGTSTLTYDNGKMNLGGIDRLCRSISDLMNSGKEVLLVSSGAIGVGIGYLGLNARPQDNAREAGDRFRRSVRTYERLFTQFLRVFIPLRSDTAYKGTVSLTS